MTSHQFMITGPLLAAVPAPGPGTATPVGLVIPDPSWTAARFGLVPVRDAWLDDATTAYLSAGDYIAAWENAHGDAFDPAAWIDVLLRLHPAGDYTVALAALNRAARFRDPAEGYQRRLPAAPVTQRARRGGGGRRRGGGRTAALVPGPAAAAARPAPGPHRPGARWDRTRGSPRCWPGRTS